ncbi:MAG: GNAT family N-acetyltransferase [Ilumatobacteraceae bacterium]
MEVRPLRPSDDLEYAGRLVVRAYLAIPRYPSDPEYHEMIADVRGRMHETTVIGAFDEGLLVGCLTFVVGHEGPHAEHGDEDATSFRYFGVEPGEMARGVGRAMVQWVIDESRRLGKKRISIHTIPVMHSAMRMYESLGFVRRPDRDQVWEPVVGWAYVKTL